ncbi:MAG: lysophospholipid acyltransferase family protein [Hyphomonadaceae bacterium]
MAVPDKITFGHRIEAAGFDAYVAAFKAMRPEKASDAGASLMRTLGPLTGPHLTALRNLRMAFPNETEAWRSDVLKGMWSEFGRTIGEFPHMAAFHTEAKGGAIEVAHNERFAEAAATGAVFIAGHFTNWEMMAVAVVESGITCHVTYRQANNPIIDKRINDTRRAYGVRLQAAKGREGGMGLLRALARRETVVLMNDQKYNEGVAAPLFGYDCMTADGPTRLALRYRLPLVPLTARRLEGVRVRVTVHEPIPLDYDAPPEREIPAAVARINAFIEARIREAPEQWFWQHKRWPKEAWERAGVL